MNLYKYLLVHLIEFHDENKSSSESGVHKELKDITNVKHTLRRTTCKHDMMNKETINL